MEFTSGAYVVIFDDNNKKTGNGGGGAVNSLFFFGTQSFLNLLKYWMAVGPLLQCSQFSQLWCATIYVVFRYKKGSSTQSSTTLNVIVETHLVAFGVASTNHFSAFFIVQQLPKLRSTYTVKRQQKCFIIAQKWSKAFKGQPKNPSFLWLDGVFVLQS